jgi:hypothetical protein
MISKRQQIKLFLDNKDYMKALKIAKSFSPNKNDKVDIYLLDNIKLGYEANLYPSFYKQLKKDPEELYQKGLKCLFELIGYDNEETN